MHYNDCASALALSNCDRENYTWLFSEYKKVGGGPTKSWPEPTHRAMADENSKFLVYRKEKKYAKSPLTFAKMSNKKLFVVLYRRWV